MLFLQYIQSITDRIHYACLPLGVKVVCNTRGKLRQELVKVKQPSSILKRKGVVDEVPCGQYEQVHVGETERTLQKCLYEHRAVVKKND